MTRAHPEWAYLRDETGPHWVNLAKGSRISDAGGRGVRRPARAVYAISSNDLVSLPQWVNSKDPEVIEQIVSVESEKHAIQAANGPGRLLDWKTVEHNGTRTLIQSVAIPWEFDEVGKYETEFTGFVPQFALYPPPSRCVALWREGEQWIAGYAREDRWVHVHGLGLAEDAAQWPSELSLTMLELGAKGYFETAERIVVWDDLPEAELRRLSEGTGLPAERATKPAPTPPAECVWELEPHAVSERRRRARSRRRALLGGLVAPLLLLAVGGGAALHLRTLQGGNEMLRTRIEREAPAAAVIESTIARWEALGPAVEPNRSPVEIFYRLATLIPEQGFRFVSFEHLDDRTVVLEGEASTMQIALQVKGAIERSEILADYRWEIPPPTQRSDLTALRAVGTYQIGLDEDSRL